MTNPYSLLLLLSVADAFHPAQEPIQNDKHVKNTAKLTDPFDKTLNKFIQKTIDDFHVAGFAVSFSDSENTYANVSL